MRVRVRTGPLALMLGLGVCAGCSTRNLQLGGVDIKSDGGPPIGDGDGGPPVDGSVMQPPTDALTPPPTDVRESDCVTAAVLLPWTAPVTPNRLDVATT